MFAIGTRYEALHLEMCSDSQADFDPFAVVANSISHLLTNLKSGTKELILNILVFITAILCVWHFLKWL